MLKSKSLWKSCIYIAMAAVVTLSITAGTFAKYTNETTASDSARVAKFSYTIGGENAEDTVDIDLFKNTYGNNNAIVGAENANVVAPGAKGTFSLDIVNTGETAMYVQVTDNGSDLEGVPIVFTYNSEEYTTVGDLATAINTFELMPASSEATPKSKEISVDWEWEYTADPLNDTADTTLGEAGTATPTVSLKISAVQVEATYPAA